MTLGGRLLTSSPPSAFGCRLRGKDGDSCSETRKPAHENVPGGVDITIVMGAAFGTGPFSYSKACGTFRPRVRQLTATRTGIG